MIRNAVNHENDETATGKAATYEEEATTAAAVVNEPVEFSKDVVDSSPTSNSTKTSQHRSRHTFAFIVFLMIGTVQLLGWNALLNSLQTIIDKIYTGEESIVDSVTITYSTVVVLATILFIRYDVVYVITTQAGLALSVIIGIVYIVAPYANFGVASAIFHTIGGLMAICAALIGSSAFGYAGRILNGYCGALSAGLGLAGVITFSVWMLSVYAIFGDSLSGTRAANWLLNVIVVVVSIVTMALLYIFMRQPWVKDAMYRSSTYDEERASDEEEDIGLLETFRRVWRLGLLYTFHMFITLFCFPTVGPVRWNVSTLNFNILVGVFQLGDLAGRYLPNAVPKMILSKGGVIIGILARTMFIITFLLTAYLNGESAFFGSFWVQFIQELLLALTNGWLCTCCFILMPQQVEGNKAKGRVGSISLLSTFIGIALGQWTAYGIMKATN